MKCKIDQTNHLYVFFFSFSVLRLNKLVTDSRMRRPKCVFIDFLKEIRHWR